MSKLYCENTPIYDDQRQMCIDPALTPGYSIENNMSMLNIPATTPFGNETPLLDLAQQEQGPQLEIPPIMGGIDAAVATHDPVYRNLLITQLYGNISNRMDEAIFSDPAEQQQNANWLTFATWASNEAGRAIREEAAPFHTGAGRFFGQGDTVDASTEALAEGNKIVFSEIAPVAAMFAHNFGGDTEYDGEKIDEFMRWMQEEAPNQDAELGNQHLQDAFLQYYNAKFEEDADLQAEMMLHANVLVGMHEQTRLQPYIEDGMPMESLRGYMTDTLLDLHVPKANTPGPVGLDIQDYEALDMGDPVSHPSYRPGGSPYAPGLEHIQTHSVAEALGQFDPDLNDLASSEPDDWTVYEDRMDYIANLFRTRQDDSRMFRKPFTAKQRNDKWERHQTGGETFAEREARLEMERYRRECMNACHGGNAIPRRPFETTPLFDQGSIENPFPTNLFDLNNPNLDPLFPAQPGVHGNNTMSDEERQQIIEYINGLEPSTAEGNRNQ